MKRIIIITIGILLVSFSAQAKSVMPFNLEIGMPRFEVEKNVTLIQGKPSGRTTSRTIWFLNRHEPHVRPEHENNWALVQIHFIQIDFENNKLKAYLEFREFWVDQIGLPAYPHWTEPPKYIDDMVAEWYDGYTQSFIKDRNSSKIWRQSGNNTAGFELIENPKLKHGLFGKVEIVDKGDGILRQEATLVEFYMNIDK